MNSVALGGGTLLLSQNWYTFSCPLTILLLSTWGFVIAIVSFIFLYAGWWLDERFNTAPTFMLGLLILGVSLCVWRLYEDANRRRAKRVPTTSLPLSP